jgi:hypothetical protein
MKRRRNNLSDGAAVALAITGVVLVPVALAGVGIYVVTKMAKKAKADFEAEMDAANATRDETDQGTTVAGGTWTSRIWNTNGAAESDAGWCWTFQSTKPNQFAKSPSCTETYGSARAKVAQLVASVASGGLQIGVQS